MVDIRSQIYLPCRTVFGGIYESADVLVGGPRTVLPQVIRPPSGLSLSHVEGRGADSDAERSRRRCSMLTSGDASPLLDRT